MSLDRAPSVVVSEVFGPTIQGEGVSLGRRCGFVRLGACNLTCSWCDTPYTWDSTRFRLKDEMRRMDTDDVLLQLLKMSVDMVVVSGGEPLLQQDKGLTALVADMPPHWRVEIETNGTIVPNGPLSTRCTFNVSPKLANGGDSVAARYNPDAINEFKRLATQGRAVFKVVCSSLDDLDEIARQYALPPRFTYIMPEGITEADVSKHLALLADEAIRRGYNVTTRLHVMLWQGERAR